jgi:hypothetical protein
MKHTAVKRFPDLLDGRRSVTRGKLAFQKLSQLNTLCTWHNIASFTIRASFGKAQEVTP